MKKKPHPLLVLSIIMLGFLSIVTISTKNSNRQAEAEQKSFYKALGNIHFKGKVINFSLIDRYSKRYALACVKLDYTNRDSIYIYQNDYCLVIKNGIAMIPVGFSPSDSKIVDSIEVNMDSDNKEIFHYKNGSIDTFNYYSKAGWLIKSDLSICK